MFSQKRTYDDCNTECNTECNDENASPNKQQKCIPKPTIPKPTFPVERFRSSATSLPNSTHDWSVLKRKCNVNKEDRNLLYLYNVVEGSRFILADLNKLSHQRDIDLLRRQHLEQHIKDINLEIFEMLILKK